MGPASLTTSPLPLAANTFWFGDRLPPVEQLCLKTMANCGHDVTLWTYDRLEGVPAEVALGDANEILPFSSFIAYKEARGARLFADIFRLELLHRGKGLWLDADCLMLKPILDDRPYIFGWEDGNRINNAVLKMPADSELLERLWAFVTTRPVVPPWWPWPKKLWQRAVYPLGLARGPEAIALGTFGPKIVTHLVRELGLQEHAQPPRMFYPVHYNETRRYFVPGAAEERITADTVCCHLWLSNIRAKVETLGVDRFYAETFLGRKFAEFGIDATA